jgi:hypothetical protein
MVILGAVDVIPHQDLRNPAYNAAQPNDDPDQFVPRDLPYALCLTARMRQISSHQIVF